MQQKPFLKKNPINKPPKRQVYKRVIPYVYEKVSDKQNPESEIIKANGVSCLRNTSQCTQVDIENNVTSFPQKKRTPPGKKEKCDGVLPYISKNFQRKDTDLLSFNLKTAMRNPETNPQQTFVQTDGG